MQRKSLSIRDILNIIEFVKVTFNPLFKKNLSLTFINAIELVIMDGMCLGIDISDNKTKRMII